MSEATFTFRVDQDLKSQFAQAAKVRDRSGAQLLRDFMREFVREQQDTAEYDDWFRRQVLSGLETANAGDLLSASDVESKFSARRELARSKLKSAH